MDILSLKQKYKKLFYIELFGTQIPFRLPSWREYSSYKLLLEQGHIPPVYWADAIFQTYVVDEALVDKMYQLPAGVIDSVVHVIMFLSGIMLNTEEDIAKLNNDLDTLRSIYERNVFDQYVALICRAFPSYTPEQIEDMDWQEILRRVIMAEQILLAERKISDTVNLRPVSREQNKSMAEQAIEHAKQARFADGAPPPDVAQAGRSDMIDPIKLRQMKMIEEVRRRRAAQ